MPTILVEILGSAKQLKAELASAQAATAKANGGFAKMGKAAGVAGLALAGGLAYGLTKSVEAASKFQGSMELIQTQAGGTTAEVHNMSKALLAMAGTVGSTPEELSKGLYHVESAGFRGAKALSILKLAAEGAAVGHSDLEATTTALVAAQRSGIKGLGDMSHAMGSLNAIVGAGNMRMDDLTAALGTGVLPVAKAFGLSIADVGGALATMTSNGIPAVNAATGLKMMMASLAAPTSAAADALKSIGLNSSELANTMRTKGLNAALVELKGHLKGSGLDATQSAALLTTAFGKKSSTALLTLIGNLDDMKKAQDQVKTGASSFGKNWDETTQSNEFKTKKLHAAIAAFGITLGTALLPAVTSVTQWLAQMANFLVQHEALAKGLVIAVGALAAILLTVSVVTALVSAATAIWTGVTAVATAAQWLWNAAMDANPIGLLIIGIAALIAAGVLLYRNSETVRAIVQGAFAGIKSAGEAAFGFLTNTVFPAFQNAWNKSGGVVGAVVEAIKGYISGLKAEIQGVINFVGDLIHGRWSKLWGDAVQIVSGILQELKAIFLSLPKAILGHLGEIAGAAQTIGEAIVNGVVSGVKALPGALSSAFSAGLSAVAKLISSFHVSIHTSDISLGPLGSIPMVTGLSAGFSGGGGTSTASVSFAVPTGLASPGGVGAPKPKSFLNQNIPKVTSSAPGADPYNVGHTIDTGGPGSASDKASKALEELKKKLQAVADAAEKVRAAVQAKMDTAFQQVKDFALKAFDGVTQAGLKKLQDHAAAVSAKIASDLSAKLAALNEANAVATASEAALSALQSQHAQAGLTEASASSAADLAIALAGGDPAAIAAAQKSVDDAAYNQRVADLTVAAAAERAAANAKLALDTKDAQDAAAVKQAAADAQAAKDVLNFNASREIKKNALTTQLDDLQKHLDEHPKAWAKTHAAIMKMFDKEFGPDFKTAGVNIGAAYINGLKQAFADVDPIASAASTATTKANTAAGKVPKMAMGGLVRASPGGTHVILGEGGRDELVTPLGGGGGGGSGGGHTFNFYGWVQDKQDVVEAIRNELIRAGRNTTGGVLGGN